MKSSRRRWPWGECAGAMRMPISGPSDAPGRFMQELTEMLGSSSLIPIHTLMESNPVIQTRVN